LGLLRVTRTLSLEKVRENSYGLVG
jgi:hypothetical protein